jgi:hypothetical protein
MVEVKFGICNNCVILKISTIGCARKTQTCFAVCYLCDGQGEVPCTECSIQEPNPSSTYEIIAIINHS